MRVLSVVTLVSPDGAYGGPLRVAVNQGAALRARGHDVTVVAGHRGYDGSPPEHLDGVPTRLFPARRLVPKTGFAGLAAPSMLPYLRRVAPDVDVAHVHLARDLVTLPAALLLLRLGVPVVLQTHGMIDPSRNPFALLLDPVLTVSVLRRAACVLYLTPTERAGLVQVTGEGVRLEQLGNGVPASDLRADPATPEVLYLARLAPRKRPGVVVEIADALAAEFPDRRYRFVGPDEGELAGLRTAMATSAADIAWEGALDPDRTVERMSRAGVYVLPSVDEPYCMTVLEAMSVGLPVVITRSNGLAGVVERRGAGLVADTDPASLTAAVRDVLSDPTRARTMGENGLAAVADELGMGPIAARLEELYARSARVSQPD